jgi:hypothetical protein
MFRNIKALAIVAAAAGVTMMTVPSQVSAQGKSQGKSHGKAHATAQGKSHSGSIIQVGKSKNGNGPAFSRSGAGHPQFGRQWCLDKGFGLGNSNWGKAGWGDVVLRRNGSRSSNVSSGTLSDILGRVIFGRLQSQSNGGALSGLWLTPATGPVVLQVQSGGRPFAEFVDRNRDGRAEVVLLNLRR